MGWGFSFRIFQAFQVQVRAWKVGEALLPSSRSELLEPPSRLVSIKALLILRNSSRSSPAGAASAPTRNATSHLLQSGVTPPARRFSRRRRRSLSNSVSGAVGSPFASKATICEVM
ncbi:hypothetical protein PIB30_063482 [Stylosanthes scabra]|uniref:Uncharacterized protein n=1 Tax=Stylosanthes scabra TaxID=79078 RepID=A0ABU6YLQ6_9FABA|nr:hypothetical protein [Stylosanthes scabra]